MSYFTFYLFASNDDTSIDWFEVPTELLASLEAAYEWATNGHHAACIKGGLEIVSPQGESWFFQDDAGDVAAAWAAAMAA